MVVKASVIFFLLSKRYKLLFDRETSIDLPVRIPALFGGGDPETGVLYVAGMEFAETAANAKNCAFILNSRTGIEQSDLAGGLTAVACTDLSELELLEEVTKLFLELHIWDSDLKEACIDNSDLSKFLNIGQVMFGHPMALMDRFFSRAAYTSDYASTFNLDTTNINRMSMDIIKDYFVDKYFIKSFEFTEVFQYPDYPCDHKDICMNIFRFGRHIGRLVGCTPNPSIATGEVCIFEHICKYIKKMLDNYDDTLVIKGRDELQLFFGKMLSNSSSVTSQETSMVVSKSGWTNHHYYSVVKFEIADRIESASLIAFLSDQLENRWYHSRSLIRENCIIWIINHSLSEKAEMRDAFYQYIAYFVRENTCRAGISDVFDGIFSISVLRDRLTQAETALRLGQIKHPHHWSYRFHDYVLDYIVEQAPGGFSKELILHKGLVKLVEYDSEYGSEYTKTLYYYLKNKFNASLAADALFVHRTTFNRRVEKMVEISGIDLNDIDELTLLLISFKVMGEITGKHSLI